MNYPPEFQKDIDALPSPLRKLLDAELAAGNSITSVGHSIPAAPIGAFFKLAQQVKTRDRASGDGLKFYARNSSFYSGEFTDEVGYFFILEPPLPPPEEPDPDAIRNVPVPMPKQAQLSSLVQRFADSMYIDYEKWRDGIGYDVALINEANAAEKSAIENLLLSRGAQGWLEVEALAALTTPHARTALQVSSRSSDTEIRMAVSRFAPDLIPQGKKVASLVAALEAGEFYGGLTQALKQVEKLHPPEVIDALFRGILKRNGDVACHFAAMLLFLHGKAGEPFDWNHRPFFLRFNTDNMAERQAALQELITRTGWVPQKGNYQSSQE